MAGLLVGVVVSSAAWAQEKAAGGVAGPAEAGKSAQAGEGKAAEGKGSGAEGKGGGGAKGPGGEGKGPGADGKGAPAGPPVGVVSVRAQSRDLPEQIAATGTVTPLASVDVRAQMSGVISRVHIKEGQFVRKGDLLFTLDSRADEANVARAVAQLAKDEAALADAQRQLQRNRELVAQRFISQGALDASQTLVESQAAVVAASKAAIEGAKVLLSYAKVVAPGSGRVGTIPVFAGSSVLANQTTLVTVTQLDPISVAFSLPQKHLADSLAALKTGGNEVLVRLPEGGETLKGRLQFVDNLIDAASGTVKVKAVFPNRDSKLWPGAFVKVDMTVRLLKESVVIPIACVIQSPRGAIVYVVQGNVANPRPVQVLYARGEEAAVTGLKPGERVVLEGRQNLRAGTNVVERPPDGGSRGPGKGGGGSGKGDGASGKGEGTPKGEPKAEPKGESKAEPKGEPKVDRKGAA